MKHSLISTPSTFLKPFPFTQTSFIALTLAWGPYESLGSSLWSDTAFQSNFADLSLNAFLEKAYNTVFGTGLGHQYATSDTFGLEKAIHNWDNLYVTVPTAYRIPHYAALAAAFGDLVGIGADVNSQLSQQAEHYVSLLGIGQAGYNAD